ncbi:efflux RND transporter permease subunit [Dinoroseobacter sp. PD6]|uniref:efflux RND transporter permease subunit n=1 Tax=Dinoroseobacter sp. PD6 TaxID=3028384 RepID=UPI00237BB4B3|nr:efflux RND transporter permease subunit [Dinoroseobacter sp. PD6]MDD9719003.1 efflux RND transporter permease subunit [Dinoroseobacter sp. PD6]
MARLIRWFLTNPVAANLAMVALVLAGLTAALNLTVRTFPEINTGAINVTVVYPGATPAEVADSILVPIEEQVTGLAGIRSIDATATRGRGTVTVQLTRAADPRMVKDDIDNAVARITTFPEAAESPRVTEVEPTEVAVELALFGTADRKTLKALAEIVRADLTGMDGISQVTVKGVAPDQIEIAVPRATLEAYAIGLTALADRIAGASIDLSGGEIDTGASTVQVRVSGEAQTADALRDTVVFTSDTGARVRLGQIATIRDGLTEDATLATIEGQPAVFLSVERTGTEQVLQITDAVTRYTEQTLPERLPPGVEATIWRNNGAQLQGRIDLLAKNGGIGAVLILIVLALFLDLRIAAWAAGGVAITFAGAFVLMQAFGVAISQLSLFGFILALGIVVDDAIVVGENTYSELEGEGDPDRAAERGILSVWRAILFSVSTTVLAFTPLLLLPGASGSFIGPVAAVVIFVLLLSLFESFFILPRHLSNIRLTPPRRFSPRRVTDGLRRRVDRGFRRFTDGPLDRAVRFAICHPVVIVAGCLVSLILTVGLVQGGKVRFEFFPRIEGNFVTAELRMPDGTSEDATLQRALDIAGAARDAADTLGADVLERTGITIGFSTGGGPGQGGTSSGSTANISAQLADAATRDITAAAFTDAWREQVGEVAGARELLFSSSLVGVGAPIALEVAAEDDSARQAAVDRITQALRGREGVRDLRDDSASTAQELVITPRADAATFGISETAIARELRAAFYGVTIDQFARSREEVDIRLRLALEDRDAVADLRRLTIPGPEGDIPLERLVEIDQKPAATSITRADGRTVTTIMADVNTGLTTGGAETEWVLSQIVPDLRADFPGLEVTAGGEQEEAGRFSNSLTQNFGLALFGIYAVLALAFGSYLRPLIVLLVLPFGFVGAVLAHAALGMNLTLLSMFGIIGLSGVVVNGALLIVDFILAEEARGTDPNEAIRRATLRRFRPITLTTLTTFLGVTPLILETSVQAQFLIPTAVSLGFGILFSSVLLMLLVPAYASLFAAGRARMQTGTPQRT